MKKNITFWVVVVIFFLIYDQYAQQNIESYEMERDKELSLDTICFKYQFFPKDTLIFKLEALDSISTLESEPFFRKRTEYFKVIVDSIDGKLNYHLIIEPIEYRSKEWVLGGDTIQRNKSNHIEKKSMIVIDSLGNRLLAKNLNTEFAITYPGGLFQPILFFNLQETCKKQMQSWLVRSSDTLVENAFPPAVINNTSLMKISNLEKSEIDTTVLITFVRTGKGLYAILNNELDMELTSVTNSYGELTLSLTRNLPIKFTMTQELKIKLKVNEGVDKPTWQNTIITYELVKQSHNDNFIQEEINRMRKELKKRK